MAITDYLTEDDISNYCAQIDDSGSVDDLLMTDMTGVFGLPYQFMDTVDRRLSGTEMGRKYSERVLARMPLLFLTPGKQQYMDDFSSDDKQSVLQYLTGSLAGMSSGDVSELITGSGKYYSFAYDYDTYYNYVNPACASVAYFLGIGDEHVTVGGKLKKLGNVDWSTATNDTFKTYFNAKENVVFYLDSMTEVSESFSNSTTESSLASTINGYSDTAQEIQFLFGQSDSVISTLLESSSSAASAVTSAVSSIASNLAGGLVGSLCDKGITSVLSGGKIMFPQIWQDSSYERSYSLSFKLRSPDNDSISIFLNVLVPYIHLVCLCLPREIDDDPNAYSSPFLVKAACKGLFNVDMGMITSLSATKGAECAWNDDGLPTQIDVSMDITDLYSQLFMSGFGEVGHPLKQAKAIKAIVSNTSYIDWLANMAGLNLAQQEMFRKVSLYFYLTKNAFTTTPSRLFTRFDKAISNQMNKLYNRTS